MIQSLGGRFPRDLSSPQKHSPKTFPYCLPEVTAVLPLGFRLFSFVFVFVFFCRLTTYVYTRSKMSSSCAPMDLYKNVLVRFKFFCALIFLLQIVSVHKYVDLWFIRFAEV